MPRIARLAPGGLVYHVLNRGVGRMDLFDDDDDYAAFIRVLAETLEILPMRVCGFCLMPNHWHLVLWPERDGQLARFMQRLTVTHVRRWVEHRRRVGWGGVYQGRYKSFPVQDDGHYLSLLRYVERNPLRANRVSRAQDWRWSSLGQARVKSAEVPLIPIDAGPLDRPRNWISLVNRPQSVEEVEAMQRALSHSRPLGAPGWTAKTELRLKLPPLRPRGRPRKADASQ